MSIHGSVLGSPTLKKVSHFTLTSLVDQRGRSVYNGFSGSNDFPRSTGLSKIPRSLLFSQSSNVVGGTPKFFDRRLG